MDKLFGHSMELNNGSVDSCLRELYVAAAVGATLETMAGAVWRSSIT